MYSWLWSSIEKENFDESQSVVLGTVAAAPYRSSLPVTNYLFAFLQQYDGPNL